MNSADMPAIQNTAKYNRLKMNPCKECGEHPELYAEKLYICSSQCGDTSIVDVTTWNRINGLTTQSNNQ